MTPVMKEDIKNTSDMNNTHHNTNEVHSSFELHTRQWDAIQKTGVDSADPEHAGLAARVKFIQV